jgi:DNA-binding NarL/FixJ family response regulator
MAAATARHQPREALVTRLLVVEDHALVREGLLQTLRKLCAEVVLFEAQDAEEALRVLDAEESFDLALLDLMLPGMNGMSLLGVMRKRYPDVPVVVLSALDDAETVSRAMRQGAAGFMPKSSSGEMLLDALRRVLDGEMFLPESLQPKLGRDRRDEAGRGRSLTDRLNLTPAQSRVLELLMQGKSNREIGDVLGLTEGTIKIHVSKVFKALNVSSRAQALVAVSRHRTKL